jgi:ankyrin repeat protein
MLVKLLLENGAGANSEDGSGQAPLMSAMLKGHQTVVELLL